VSRSLSLSLKTRNDKPIFLLTIKQFQAREATPEPTFGGGACFGSSATGCVITEEKRDENNLLTRAPEPVPEPTFGGGGCFGSSATGCVITEE